MFLLAWTAAATATCLAARKLDNYPLMTVGAVMVMMTAAIA